ncbi:hypothetical protein FGB62_310g03 [Gracilaria domingensis]|nr:hypothetical protein FGB62_310g03 [Gracilaria domingensis]
MRHREKNVMEVGKGMKYSSSTEGGRESATTPSDAETRNAGAQREGERGAGEEKNNSRSQLTRQSDSDGENDGDTPHPVFNVRREHSIQVRDAVNRRPAARENRAVTGSNTGRKQPRKKFRQPRPVKKQRGVSQLDDVQSVEKGEIPGLCKKRHRISRKAPIFRAPLSEEDESSSGKNEV